LTKNNQAVIEPHKKGSKIIRGLWFTAGTICLVLGAIGIVLPILPTTPFLLASAACYYKSSSKMHKWLIHNKWFGEYIRNYQEGKGIPIKTKIIALTVLWVTIGVSTFFFLERILPTFLVLPMQLTMIIVAILVTIYMSRLPTYKPP
jgi:hypothetical protein